MAKDEFKKLKDVTLKGALTVEASRMLPHARDVGFLTGTSVPGILGVGIAGKTSDVALKMITGKRKRKRR